MINSSETKKKFARNWFVFLQSQILKQFQDFEKEFSKSKKGKISRFVKREWNKSNVNEGGGTYFILRNGEVFDKVGINQSTVSGVFKKEFRSKIPGASKNGTIAHHKVEQANKLSSKLQPPQKPDGSPQKKQASDPPHLGQVIQFADPQFRSQASHCPTTRLTIPTNSKSNRSKPSLGLFFRRRAHLSNQYIEK